MTAAEIITECCMRTPAVAAQRVHELTLRVARDNDGTLQYALVGAEAAPMEHEVGNLPETPADVIERTVRTIVDRHGPRDLLVTVACVNERVVGVSVSVRATVEMALFGGALREVVGEDPWTARFATRLSEPGARE